MNAPTPPTFTKVTSLSEAVGPVGNPDLSTETEEALPRPIEDPPFLEWLGSHRGQNSRMGALARSIDRDYGCFPPEATINECFDHVNEVHDGQPNVIDGLHDAVSAWIGVAVAKRRGEPLRREYGPRQPILEAAMESGLNVSGNLMAFCWNDDPTSDTCGHFGGNKERSLRLYPENDSFFCHQCGIFGWSDQLKARTWQSRTR